MEPFSWKKFFAGFGNTVGWFKALAIGVRVIVIVAAVLAMIWLGSKVKAWLFPPKANIQTQTQAGVFTGSVGQVTYSQPVNVDYVKIADIVQSKQKKWYAGFTLNRNNHNDNDWFIGGEIGRQF